jgi:hypothetical protein
MLAPAWELHATATAQCRSEDLHQVLASIILDESILEPAKPHNQSTGSTGPAVMVATDTRPSSPALMECASAGVVASGTRVHPLGTCTTPMLHFVVREQEDGLFDHYYSSLLSGFTSLTAGVWCLNFAESTGLVDHLAAVHLLRCLLDSRLPMGLSGIQA